MSDPEASQDTQSARARPVGVALAPSAGLASPSTPAWAERLTRLLDDGFRVPGTSFRFGLDGVLGALLPGAGDALTALGSIALLVLALQRNVPTVVLLRMLLNIAIDAVVGALPVVGDIFDFAYRSNRKNLTLIQQHGGGARSAGVSDYLVVGAALGLVALGVVVPVLVWALLLRWFESR